MKTFARKPNQPQNAAFPNRARPRTTPSHPGDRLLSLQRTIGNQAMRRVLQTHAAKAIQTKLTISEPGDEYEQEAERISTQVMRMPEPQLQRACACGGCRDCQSEKSGQQGHVQTKQIQSSNTGHVAAPPNIGELAQSRGEPLDLTTRTFMEPRFGANFGTIRIHTDGHAQRFSADLNADAFTIGNDIFFARNKWNPTAASGRHLLAHELAHTVQQSGDASTIQRFVPCTQATLSLEECPHRDPGEKSASRGEPSVLIFITSPEVGYLITNFDIGKSKLKASAKVEPDWSQMIQEISKPGSKWQVLGFSDCHGEEARNQSLRQQRADAVLAALPASATANIIGASGAFIADCITDNSTRHHRAWNRAVFISPEERAIDFEGEEIEVKPPVIQEADTEDCDKNQRDALTRALALAKRMVQAALLAIDEGNPLLKMYFGKDEADHRNHIRQNFVAISKGLKAGPTFECEEPNSDSCDGAHAYVYWILGENIHICPSAISAGDNFLARTIVHEAAHGYAWIFFPDELCAGGCPSMDTEDAEDNADSYGEFAGEALAQSP